MALLDTTVLDTWQNVSFAEQTRYNNCIVWNAHNAVFGSKRLAIYALAVYFLHSARLVSRDSIVDRHWLPATD